MRAIRLHPATLAATCLLVLAGCGSVAFEQPLCDEKTAELDEKLIGWWEFVPACLEEEEPGPGELWPRLAVGKTVDKAPFMEAVAIEMKDDVVEVRRLELRATTIGGRRYLCLFNEKEADEGYFVVRYEHLDDDRLRIELLDEEVFAKAVEAGELAGKVTGSGEDSMEPVEVVVSTPAAEVRAWIEKHADTCVKTETLELRRLVEKDSEDEAVAKPSEGPDEEDGAEDDE